MGPPPRGRTHLDGPAEIARTTDADAAARTLGARKTSRCLPVRHADRKPGRIGMARSRVRMPDRKVRLQVVLKDATSIVGTDRMIAPDRQMDRRPAIRLAMPVPKRNRDRRALPVTEAMRDGSGKTRTAARES